MLKNSSQFLLSEHHCEPKSLDFSLNIAKIKKVAWKILFNSATEQNNLSSISILWSGKGDKIKRNVMIGDYSAERGLKMIDLESFNKAPGSKNTLTQKIMVNGSTFFALNCNFLVGLPSLEAASNRT